MYMYVFEITDYGVHINSIKRFISNARPKRTYVLVEVALASILVTYSKDIAFAS